MRNMAIVLAVGCLAIGCNKLREKPSAESVDKISRDVPSIVTQLITAIDQRDWDQLSQWAKDRSTSKELIRKWKMTTNRVGELSSVIYKSESDGIPCVCYVYEITTSNGGLYPHQLHIFVRENGTHVELVDFYEFGW